MALRLHLNRAQPHVLLLDGPTGTELERRGYRTTLPLWTALAPREAPDLLLQIHQDYVQAGADILTACTFRTSHYTLAKQGLESDAVALTSLAVSIARQAASSSPRPTYVAGSIAPLEDCYHPALTPNNACLRRYHELHAHSLACAGVDLLLVESMPTQREALCASQAALATGLPVFTSLLVGPNATLCDGSQLESALSQLCQSAIDLVAVNCAPYSWCSAAMPPLSNSGKPFGAYANSSTPDGSFGNVPLPLDVDLYASTSIEWLRWGAQLIGGCCGMRPDHIARVRSVLDSLVYQPSDTPQ